MSGAREALQESVRSALAAIGLAAFDAPPVRGALPHVVVDEPELRDWSAATWTGREGTIALAFHDAGERPLRLRATIGTAEEAVAAIGPALPGGWRVARLRLQRSRLQRRGERWLGTSEFQVRMYRENG